jgi:hypothetical protein
LARFAPTGDFPASGLPKAYHGLPYKSRIAAVSGRSPASFTREVQMRSFWIILAAILATAAHGATQAPPARDPASAPSAILTAARAALGGDERLSGIRTFVATGRTRQVRGNNLVPIEFEIWCELPDKYLRRDEVPAQESGPTSTGFNGDALILWPPAYEPASGAAAKTPTTPAPAAPTAGAAPAATSAPPAPPDPRLARVVSIKQDFVRLTLGMFAASFASYPVTFSAAGQAEAPQGRAEVIDVKGAGAFALKLFINSDTHLPIMVSWTTPATNVVLWVPGQPQPENVAPGSIVVKGPPLPGAAATKDELDKYAKDIQDLRKKTLAGAKPVEHRIYYGDYHDIGNGLRFPFRLRRATAGETIEETNFDEFKTNVRIDPRRFSSAK